MLEISIIVGIIAAVFLEGIDKFVTVQSDTTTKEYDHRVFEEYSDNLGTNLTDSNFIGFADANYSSGQTATIQIIGSVDDAQSGLVSGTKYYLQRDGSLFATPDVPNIVAGTAIDSNKILIKK